MSGRTTRILLGVVVAAVGCLLALSASAATTGGSKNRLSKHDRALIAQARATGDSTVMLLVAAKGGAANDAERAIEALGGSIRFKDESVGYLRARVAIDKAEEVAALESVEAVDVDELIPLPTPTPAADDSPAVDPPGPTTPGQNAYMPTRDIGAPQFVAANPTYDGRGVKIGIVDTGVDLLTPELQTAKTVAGASAPKIADWVTGTHPIDDGDPTWINMADQVNGATFTWNGAAYTAPAAGSYRIGAFRESNPSFGGEFSVAGSPGGDLNRDGDETDVFAVLWDAAANKVWVDTNGDRSFADQAAMTDFRVNRDMGVFGTDNPATAVRETVPFVVQTDGKLKYVNIGIVSGAHGTHVAGIAAGKDFFGGAYDGAAPEAQIVTSRACLFVAGCTAHALVEGMIWVAKQANVDVINMSIGGLPALNDGNNARAIVYNRLIDQTGAQMFISAGNSGPGVNTVGDPSVATRVMSVAAYVTKDTWMANYGAVAAKDEQLFVFSSRGPREDGGFKPNISAPGAAVSSIPGWQAGSPVGGTYALPPGYGMFNGTSMAAPQATGGAALLISGAKQAGVQWKPDQLRQAVSSSARYIGTAQAHEQGNGLMQVGAAWELLRTNIKTVEITSSAPVKTVISGFLATPHAGPGIYEREGWSAGQSGQRTITFTRTSGGGGDVTYNLTWVGNDGTFTSAGSITLPRGSAVPLTVGVSPATAGVHSAILRLDDPATTGTDYAVLNTVIAAEQMTAGNNFSVTRAGSADRPDKATFFFNVPAATPAFKVDVTNITGRVRVLRFHPYGVPFDSTTTTPYQTGGSLSRTVSNPTPGVWEVTVDTSRASAVSPATFNVTGSLLGVDVTPALWTINPAVVGTAYTQEFTFKNRFGSYTGNEVGTPFGSASSARPTIANLAQQTYTLAVPAGTTSLTATIGNPSDASADLDLFVFDPAGGLAGQSADGDSEESVTVSGPAAGTWTVLIDGYSVPAGSTAYDYLDVFAHGSFGSITLPNVPLTHPNGEQWTRTATATPLAAPAAGRYLRGFVQARSGTVVLGQAEVRATP